MSRAAWVERLEQEIAAEHREQAAEALAEARQASRRADYLETMSDSPEAWALFLSMLPRRRGAVGAPNFRPLSAPTSGGVYAIQSGQFVKIGRSGNIALRLARLQTAHPKRLRLVAILSRDPADESRFHERFALLRTHGEWFHFRGEVAAAILQSRNGATP